MYHEGKYKNGKRGKSSVPVTLLRSRLLTLRYAFIRERIGPGALLYPDSEPIQNV